MSRKLLILFAVALLAVTVLSPISAGAQTSHDATIAGNDYVTVTLTGKPAAADDSTKVNGRFDSTSKGYQQALSRMQRQHDRFAAQLAKVAPDAEIVDEYFITANAVALKLNGSSLSAIGNIAGVEKAAQSALYSLDLNTSVDLINAPAFWSENGGQSNAGEGVKVGIIDSGIYPGHPFFTCKDIHFGGIYYSGVGMAPPNAALPAYFGPGYIPAPAQPLYFSSSHGTHVAGIIGGCDTTIDGGVWTGTELSGVAPGAELYDYNVFPAFGAGYVAFGGSAFSHDIAHAIEDAVAGGMQVINMSLGGGVQGPHDFLADVANEAVEAGVVVVTSAGNEGPGWYTVGSPGSGSEVIAVGASTNSRTGGVIIQVDGGPTYYGVPGEFPYFDGSSYSVIDWPGSDNEACDSNVPDGSLSGEVVVIARGSCTFSQKVANAKAAGAGGAIIYTYDGAAVPVMARSAGFDDDLPAVAVSYDDGVALEAGVTATISPPTAIPTTPDQLADFSSRGPAPFTYIIKPDVVAPGVDILSSTIQFNLLGVTDTTWELYNGTSMASPHVAGAAAALLAANPGWGVNEVRSALVNTADTTKPGLSVFEQGGGLIDMVAADSATVSFYPANASFGIFKGNKPANGAIDISISSTGCSVADVTGSTYADASVSGSTLTVTFDGGRTATSDFYGGYVDVSCGAGGDYTIPWGAVVNR